MDKETVKSGKLVNLVKRGLKSIDSFFSKMQNFQDAGAAKPQPQHFRVFPASETEGVYFDMLVTPRGEDGEYVDLELSTPDKMYKLNKKAVRFDMPELTDITTICQQFMYDHFGEDSLSDIVEIKNSIKINLKKVTSDDEISIELGGVFGSVEYDTAMNMVEELVQDDGFVDELPENTDAWYELSNCDDNGYELSPIDSTESFASVAIKETLTNIIKVDQALTLTFLHLDGVERNKATKLFDSYRWSMSDVIHQLGKLSSNYNSLDYTIDLGQINVWKLGAEGFYDFAKVSLQNIVDNLQLLSTTLPEDAMPDIEDVIKSCKTVLTYEF